MAKAPNREKSTGDLLRQRRRNAQAKRAVLREVRIRQELGIYSRNREWSLARLFSDFINAPQRMSSRQFEQFKKNASRLAEPIGFSAIEEIITDNDLIHVQNEARKVINWFVEERGKRNGMSTAPLIPVPQKVFLHRVGGKIERGFSALDFKGRILSHLFDLMCSGRTYFWRCKMCRRIFARRGRKIYCNMRCLEKARPAEERRDYFRQYMKKRRLSLNRVMKKNPELADRVKLKEIKLRDALKEMGRRKFSI